MSRLSNAQMADLLFASESLSCCKYALGDKLLRRLRKYMYYLRHICLEMNCPPHEIVPTFIRINDELEKRILDEKLGESK